MEFIAGRSFTKQHKQFLQANDKLFEGMDLHTKKTSDFSLNIETIKQTHKIMMDKEKQRDGKDVFVGVYRKSSVFAGYHIFTSAGLIERRMEDAIFKFHKT